VSTIEELLGEEKVAVPVLKPENTAVGIRCADHPLSIVGTYFADKRRSRTEATEIVCVFVKHREAYSSGGWFDYNHYVNRDFHSHFSIRGIGA
jgi:hypothetical protein